MILNEGQYFVRYSEDPKTKRPVLESVVVGCGGEIYFQESDLLGICLKNESEFIRWVNYTQADYSKLDEIKSLIDGEQSEG